MAGKAKGYCSDWEEVCMLFLLLRAQAESLFSVEFTLFFTSPGLHPLEGCPPSPMRMHVPQWTGSRSTDRSAFLYVQEGLTSQVPHFQGLLFLDDHFWRWPDISDITGGVLFFTFARLLTGCNRKKIRRSHFPLNQKRHYVMFKSLTVKNTGCVMVHIQWVIQLSQLLGPLFPCL